MGQYCLGCIRWVIVVLKGELTQSEVAYTVEQVFFKDLSVLYLAALTLPSVVTSLPVPAQTLPKEFRFFSSEQIIFFIMFSEAFKCCLGCLKPFTQSD